MSIYNETFSELVLKKKYIYVTLAGYRNILQLSYDIIKGNAYYLSTDKVNSKRRWTGADINGFY